MSKMKNVLAAKKAWRTMRRRQPPVRLELGMSLVERVTDEVIKELKNGRRKTS